MEATITKRETIAKNTILVTFAVPSETRFFPGQYCSVVLSLPSHDPSGNWRDMSIVNAPFQKGEITILLRLSDSLFKNTLLALPMGSKAEISYIAGGFVLPNDVNKKLVFIAGGVGIAPFMSMIEHIRHEHIPFSVVLFYVNQTSELAAFLDELQKIKEPWFTFVPIMTRDKTWKNETQKINKELLTRYVSDYKNCLYFLSGKPTMVEEVFESLIKIGIASQNILTEMFAGYE